MIFWVVFALITGYPCLKSKYAYYVHAKMCRGLHHSPLVIDRYIRRNGAIFIFSFCQGSFRYSSSDLQDRQVSNWLSCLLINMSLKNIKALRSYVADGVLPNIQLRESILCVIVSPSFVKRQLQIYCMAS